MYSVLKSQKRKLNHHIQSPVTTATFLNSTSVVFTFLNGIYIVVNIHSENQIQKQDSIPFKNPITKAQRIGNNSVVMVSKYCSQIYVLKLFQNKETQLISINGGFFFNILNENPQSNLMNLFGCQSTLYGFNSGSFAIKHYLYQDRKIVIDFFNHKNNFSVTSQEIDLQLHGIYHIQVCDKQQGEFAIYKEEQIQQALWKLRILRLSSTNDKEKEVILPGQMFHEQIIIRQVLKWVNNSYLLLTQQSQNNWDWKNFIVNPQFNPPVQPYNNFQFLKSMPFLKQICYIDLKKQVFYAILYTHERVEGELYENGLLVCEMKSGQILEKGYCSLKNTNISADGRYIVDIPSQMQSYGTLFYHLRLLLSKSSLYLYLIDNSEMQSLNDSFKEQIVSLL